MWSPTSTDWSGPASRKGESATTVSAFAIGLPNTLAGTDIPMASAPAKSMAPRERSVRPPLRFGRAFLSALFSRRSNLLVGDKRLFVGFRRFSAGSTGGVLESTATGHDAPRRPRERGRTLRS